MGPLYSYKNCTLLLLFGLCNQAPKRNQKSKRKRKIHEKTTYTKKTRNPTTILITKS